MTRARTLRAAVGIVGAGPAGLLLANFLHRRGVDSVVVDKFTREQVHARARAGFIEWRNMVLLEEAGLGGRMLAEGRAHGRCEFRRPGRSFVLDYEALAGGRGHWVYPQQELVSDLTDAFLAAGGPIHFGVSCASVETGDRPVAVCADVVTGEEVRLECDVLAGCDGFYGPVRAALPESLVVGHGTDHPFQWLAVLVAAPPSSEHVIYAHHPHGYAGHMMRTSTVSRYYLQCARGDEVDAWPDDRIWSELHARLAADGFTLLEGPVVERSMLSMRSVVFEPMQHGPILLLGDAAHIITPCGGKGMNLALQDAVAAAELVERHLAGDGAALAEYGPRRLPDVWRAQEFSHWFLHMLNTYDADDQSGFLQRLQGARLDALEEQDAFARHFAAGYVGP